ncbi:aprataxin and PNK-like factor isoform X2 [Lithobates pipiens]
MECYQLEETESRAKYSIPQGETMIGRGAFLGVADKRVSRNHAVLEVVDDKLRIKPIHVNPCFYQASNNNTFIPLKRDEWFWLHSGDCISLLPDKYSFRVIAQHPSQEATISDCGAKTEVEEPSCSGMDNIKPVSSRPCEKTKDENCSDLSSAVTYKVNVEQSRLAPRKRTLPNWMLQGDLTIQSLPSPVVKAGKKRRNVTADRTKKTVESGTEERQQHPIKSRDDGDEGVMKKSKVAVKTEDLPGTSTEAVPARVKHESLAEPVIENEEEMEVKSRDHSPCPSPRLESSGSPAGSSATKPCQTSDSPEGNNGISQNGRSLQAAQQASKSRMSCMYAERCYRKNPVHFQEFSHPGDSDYRGSQQDDYDDRLECPYGTDCYRKNPQHKLEYKHTKPPGRRLRKRTTKKAKKNDDSDDDGEPNEYDLEDSFIDDDDEEEEDFTDEDSDWMPDSQDKDSEDVQQLVKEAKRFVKGKH